MRRFAKIAGIGVGSLAGFLVLVAAVIWLGANTDPGRRALAWLLPRVTGGQIHARGIGGTFPAHLTARNLTVSDGKGVWLETTDVRLDWRPAALLSGKIVVDRLSAAKARLVRFPKEESSKNNANTQATKGNASPLVVHDLDVADVEVGATIARDAPSFSLRGSLGRGSSAERIAIDAHASDGGRYKIDAKRAIGAITLAVDATEPAHGLLARLAGLPDIGALRIAANATGPEDALRTRLEASAGALQVQGAGTLDLEKETGALSLAAHSAAMAPRPDLSWETLALGMTIKGTLRRPTVSGLVSASKIEAGGAKLAGLEASVEGTEGKIRLVARFSGIELPGSAPELLAGAPLMLDARLDLDAKGSPVAFSLHHPLIAADGTIDLALPRSARAEITLPDLAPLGALAGLALDGRATLAADAKDQAGKIALRASGELDLGPGATVVQRLLGAKTRFQTSANIENDTIDLTALSIDGDDIALDAHGTLARAKSALAFRVKLDELARLDPGVAGALEITGKAHGNSENMALATTIEGTLGMASEAPGAIHVQLTASGPARAPEGKADVRWELAGAPLEATLDAARDAAGGITIAIERASWRSAAASGKLVLGEAGSESGAITFKVGTLADFSDFVGMPIAGSLDGELAAMPRANELRLTANGKGLTGASVGIGSAKLTASLKEPKDARRLTMTLALGGVHAGDMRNASATLTAEGPATAPSFSVRAAAAAFGGTTVAASGALDVAKKSVRLNSLTSDVYGLDGRLLAPTTVDFAHGLALGQTRIGAGGAELTLAGAITPDLKLNATLRGVTSSLLARFMPEPALAGRLEASANLSGTLAKPAGTLRIEGRGLGLATPEMRGLPLGALVLTARLANGAANLDGALSFGTGSRVTISGSVPLAAGRTIDLTAAGALDLAALNPVLGAGGRHASGRLSISGTVRGSLGAPAIAGELTLGGASFTDFASGVRLTDVGGSVGIANGTLRLSRLSARAGAGRISVAGTVGLGGAVPVALQFEAKDAELLQSDQIKATLDSSLALTGSIVQGLAVGGTVGIQRAEIRIPKRMPASIPTLDVVRPGSTPAKQRAAASASSVALDVVVSAARRIFVRGRGVDAEFGGRVHVTGTSAAPRFAGGFHLIRGDLALAGRTLNFTKGTIAFNGGSVTDPALDLEATTSTASTTATLVLGGSAQHPTVKLSSTPDLPQDQILGALLFGQSATNLSPFQLAEIANALASLSGTGPSVGNPLGAIREGLGLDRLSVGSSATGSPTLQAGRYIAPGVYVGASEAANGGGASANVEIDLSKHLKLKARVGNRASGAAAGTPADQSTSVGLSYQFEY